MTADRLDNLERELSALWGRLFALEAWRDLQIEKSRPVASQAPSEAFQEYLRKAKEARERMEAEALARRPTGDEVTAEDVERDKAEWMLE